MLKINTRGKDAREIEILTIKNNPLVNVKMVHPYPQTKQDEYIT